MKILFVATPNSGGHHLTYYSSFCEEFQDYVLVTEKYLPNESHKQYADENLNFGTKKFGEYCKILKLIREVARKEKPDLIHIQCGDNFYRFMGIGLKHLHCKHIVITFHHVRGGKLHDLSIKRICKSVDFGVVHTKSLKNTLESKGIRNAVHIEYPYFGNNENKVYTPAEAKENLGIPEDDICISFLGSARKDKGLDILLSALNNVNNKFTLLIAGKLSDVSVDKVKRMIETYQNSVILLDKYLSNEEFDLAVSASDIIALPYRKEFDGASGPLGEGVAKNKMIIGPNHGSLGNIISENHLGYTFESESVESLSSTIQKALDKSWEIDESYRQYQHSLNPETFLKKYRQLFEKTVD